MFRSNGTVNSPHTIILCWYEKITTSGRSSVSTPIVAGIVGVLSKSMLMSQSVTGILDKRERRCFFSFDLEPDLTNGIADDTGEREFSRLVRLTRPYRSLDMVANTLSWRQV